LTAARCQIEVFVLRDAVTRGDLDWESDVISAHHRLTRTPQMADDDPERMNDAWIAAHAAFHRALLDGARNRKMLAIAESLRDSTELYRRWSLPVGHDQSRDIAGEHRELRRTALDRDPDRAAHTLLEHIRRTRDALLTNAGNAPASEQAEDPNRSSGSRPANRSSARPLD
jgi:DNA-binding GntR family transcriptional regulator